MIDCNVRRKAAYKQFVYVNASVIVIVILAEVFLLPSPTTQEPSFVIRKTYMTSQCQDGRRLGNLMFNYASLFGISRRYNATALVQTDFPLLDVFTLSAARTDNIDNALGMYRNYEEYGKRACGYDIQTERFTPPVLNTKLHGYYQSWRYFNASYASIRKEFKFQDAIIQKAQAFHASLSAQHTARSARVAVHIRRGDVLDPDKANYGYTTPSIDYYNQTMRAFNEVFPSVIFIVCSDDVTWARDNIKGLNVHYSTSVSPEVDLAIVSLCDHVIISVGSFGWWGAFLANGITVYYDNWPRPVSMLEYMVTKKDYFLPEWIGVYEKTKYDDLILAIKRKLA